MNLAMKQVKRLQSMKKRNESGTLQTCLNVKEERCINLASEIYAEA